MKSPICTNLNHDGMPNKYALLMRDRIFYDKLAPSTEIPRGSIMTTDDDIILGPQDHLRLAI